MTHPLNETLPFSILSKDISDVIKICNEEQGIVQLDCHPHKCTDDNVWVCFAIQSTVNLLLNGIYSAILASITPLLHGHIFWYADIYKVNRLHEIEFKKRKDYLFAEKYSFLRGGKKISLNTLGRFSVSSLSYESIQVYFLWQW